MSTTVAWRLVLLLGFLAGSAAGTTLLHPNSEHEPTLDLTFPLPQGAEFRDDYDAGRGGGRAHRGVDVFAAAGTRVYAARSGTVEWMPGRHASAGYALQIRGDDGRTYAYYHLGPDGGPHGKAYAAGLREGSAVRRGQHIGYVGDSGNAVGGRPHLHFEIHDDAVTDPYGTNRLNPYPSLADAQRRGDFPRAGGATSRSGRQAVLREGDRGADVATWQHLLNEVRDTPVGVDGVFGPETLRATRDFQRAADLTVDGVVGPQTRSAMAASAPSLASARSALLRQGDRGSDVAAWQRQLNTVRRSPIGVDGIFGPQTDGATRALQRSAGITVDGIVGPKTRAAARR